MELKWKMEREREKEISAFVAPWRKKKMYYKYLGFNVKITESSVINFMGII